MIISLLAALDEKGGIGYRGRLPWHLSDDLKNFRRLTMGHHLIMGRVTYDVTRGKLPGRKLIVLSRNPDFEAADAALAASLADALEIACRADEDEVFVIGGAQVFEQALRLAERLYLTRVHAEVQADAFFPEFDESEWKLLDAQAYEASPKNDHSFTIQRWERRPGD